MKNWVAEVVASEDNDSIVDPSQLVLSLLTKVQQTAVFLLTHMYPWIQECTRVVCLLRRWSNIKLNQPLKSNKIMFWTLDTNISLASLQLPSIKLVYLDPYNNTFGEEDWFVALFVVVLCILSIILMISMLGIVMFVNFGIHDENRKLLDELMSFGMITSIMMLLPAAILMTYRNVFGPLLSIFLTKMLLNVLTV